MIKNNKKFAREQYGLIDFDLCDLANLMSMFAHDLLFIHHHAIGDKFDTIHKITGDLYEKALKDLDSLSEKAISCHEKIGNFALLEHSISDVYGEVIEKEEIGWLDFIKLLEEKGNIIVDALRSVREDYPRDIISMIDNLVDSWDTEINYKNAARLK